MAQTFQRTDGDIASVLGLMFRSPEFNAAPKAKFKDPMQFVLSAVRLAYDDKVVLNTGPIQGWLARLAQGLYAHETPDGYPMNAAAWSGPGQMAVRFEIARQIGIELRGPVQAAGTGRGRPPGVSAAAERALLHEPAADPERRRPAPRSTRRCRPRTGTRCSCPPPNSCGEVNHAPARSPQGNGRNSPAERSDDRRRTGVGGAEDRHAPARGVPARRL